MGSSNDIPDTVWPQALPYYNTVIQIMTLWSSLATKFAGYGSEITVQWCAKEGAGHQWEGLGGGGAGEVRLWQKSGTYYHRGL